MLLFFYSCFLYLLQPWIWLIFWRRCRRNVLYRQFWRERIGLQFLSKSDVWVHCVSLGEAKVIIPTLLALFDQYPSLIFYVTCSSPSARALIEKKLGHHVSFGYLPFDFYFCMRRFIEQLQPKICLIVEREWWPNMLGILERKKIPVVLCNARLSESSLRQYYPWRWFMRSVLSAFTEVLVQAQQDKKRLEKLGIPSTRMLVTGSVKYDLEIEKAVIDEAISWRNQWVDRPVWVAGSVHASEFNAILSVHQKLLQKHENALLVIAPRHPERFELCAKRIELKNLKMAKRSLKNHVHDSIQVLLVDTIGELLLFYGTADVVFIGGSLVEYGGHNPIEAAALSVPCLIGPYHENFVEICAKLHEKKGLSYIGDAIELYQHVLFYFTTPEVARNHGVAGLDVVTANQGATLVQYNTIASYLAEL
ncbi:MAG: 3-deoxy-D-manno-octulosonic acid transferase [Shewanellaceae bacterium]|nr:3-deoxy-D-manno-octulosonic acid transferase [Shewanellaceae bacterium]